MTIALLIFSISGVGIIVFYILRYYQQESGNHILWPEKRASIDYKLQSKLIETRQWFEQKAQGVSGMPEQIKERTKLTARRLEHVIDANSGNLVSKVRGKLVINRDKRASPHLRTISNAKQNAGRKIEEEAIDS